MYGDSKSVEGTKSEAYAALQREKETAIAAAVATARKDAEVFLKLHHLPSSRFTDVPPRLRVLRRLLWQRHTCVEGGRLSRSGPDLR